MAAPDPKARIDKAIRHIRKFKKHIREALSKKQIRKARHLARLMAMSIDTAIVASYQACHRRLRTARKQADEAASEDRKNQIMASAYRRIIALAVDTSPFDEQGGEAIAFDRPKANGDQRTLISFPEDWAILHHIFLLSTKELITFNLRTDQVLYRGGMPAVSRAMTEAINEGYRYFMEIDVKGAFDAFNNYENIRDLIFGLTGLGFTFTHFINEDYAVRQQPRNRSAQEGRCRSATVSAPADNEGRYTPATQTQAIPMDNIHIATPTSSNLDLCPDNVYVHADPPAPITRDDHSDYDDLSDIVDIKGLPQGAAYSSLVFELLLSEVLKNFKLPEGTKLIIYADNVILLAKSRTLSEQVCEQICAEGIGAGSGVKALAANGLVFVVKGQPKRVRGAKGWTWGEHQPTPRRIDYGFHAMGLKYTRRRRHAGGIPVTTVTLSKPRTLNRCRDKVFQVKKMFDEGKLNATNAVEKLRQIALNMINAAYKSASTVCKPDIGPIVSRSLLKASKQLWPDIAKPLRLALPHASLPHR